MENDLKKIDKILEKYRAIEKKISSFTDTYFNSQYEEYLLTNIKNETIEVDSIDFAGLIKSCLKESCDSLYDYRDIANELGHDSKVRKKYSKFKNALTKILDLVEDDELYNYLITIELMIEDYDLRHSPPKPTKPVTEGFVKTDEQEVKLGISDLRKTLLNLDKTAFFLNLDEAGATFDHERKLFLHRGKLELTESAKKSQLKESYIIAATVFANISTLNLSSPKENVLSFWVSQSIIRFIRDQHSDFASLKDIPKSEYFNEFKRKR